jgi:RNA polymerase sigma-B factor
VNRVTNELATELGRAPTTSEIAGRAGATDEQVLDAWEASGAYRAISLDAPSEDDEEDPWTIPLGGEEPGYRTVERASTLDPLLRTLSEREREILRLRFAEDLTQSEIAAIVGLSQMHVSRLIRASIARLQAAAREREPGSRRRSA